MLLRKIVEEKTGIKTVVLDQDVPNVVHFHSYFCTDCGIHTAVDQRLEDQSDITCSCCQSDEFLTNLEQSFSIEGLEPA
ncbi:hypothetical protein [Rossellomorea marisflavi]|uniref:hypothetical protein n=1 Tax=Rossellomorea marisflavi TaxID=189381 RepID=UPI003D2EC925